MIFERILLDLIKLQFKCHYRDALFTSFFRAFVGAIPSCLLNKPVQWSRVDAGGCLGKIPQNRRVLHNVMVCMQPTAVIPAGCGVVGALALGEV